MGTKVRSFANFEQRKDGRQVVSRFEHELEEREVYLRIERTGKRFVGSPSYDGKVWEACEAIEADLPERLTVGVVAVNSASAGFGCTFADFSVVGK